MEICSEKRLRVPRRESAGPVREEGHFRVKNHGWAPLFGCKVPLEGTFAPVVGRQENAIRGNAIAPPGCRSRCGTLP